jgi:hypothetical protein
LSRFGCIFVEGQVRVTTSIATVKSITVVFERRQTLHDYEQIPASAGPQCNMALAIQQLISVAELSVNRGLDHLYLQGSVRLA